MYSRTRNMTETDGRSKVTMIAHKLEEIEKIWPSVAPIFSVPQTPEAYSNLVRLLDDVANKVGEDEKHPLALLMDTLGTLIEAYETEHFPEPDVSPSETLIFLMEEHGLQQNDLPELGSQEAVSEILAGKRKLDIHQIHALSKRFNVAPSVFFED